MQNKFKRITSFDILYLKNNSQFFKTFSNFFFLDWIRKNFLDFFKIIIVLIITSFFLWLRFNQLYSELNLITET